jgi:hypothetical protein
MAQRHAEKIEQFLSPRSAGPKLVDSAQRELAKMASQTLMGGDKSLLPFGIGLQEAVPFSPYVAEESGAMVREGVETGSPLTTGLGLGLGALQAFPVFKPIAKGVQAGAMAAGRAGERLAERVVPQVMERGGLGAEMLGAMGTGSQSAVIKPKGLSGNWLANEVERQTKGLKVQPDPPYAPYNEQELQQAAARGFGPYDPETGVMPAPVNPENAALNNWVDKKLTKYIKAEMGTPEDPVRALAERGVLHYEPMALDFGAVPSQLMKKRASAGMQAPLMGKSDLARRWEMMADKAIDPSRARDWTGAPEWGLIDEAVQSENPWLTKVPEDTPVYTIKGISFFNQDAGFDHLLDELKNAVRADSDLPAHLRYSPKDLEKVTVPQAVERVAKINEYRANKKAEANAAIARNSATIPVKEYPEAKMTWVEFQPPKIEALPEDVTRRQMSATQGGFDVPGIGFVAAKWDPKTGLDWAQAENDVRKLLGRKPLSEALDYEGDLMGHCAGRYCDDVISGNSRIYSLRDEKGNPKVTIEVKPGQVRTTHEDIDAIGKQATEEANSKNFASTTDYDLFYWPRVRELQMQLIEQKRKTIAPQIVQIKGSGKKDPGQRIRPEDSHLLPFIHDFVKSGTWSSVADLKNAGMTRLGDKYVTNEEIAPLVAEARKFIDETPALEQQRQAQRAYEAYRGPIPSPEYTQLQKEINKQVHPDIPYTYSELRSIFDDPNAYDEGALGDNLERVNQLRKLFGDANYAQGGFVQDTDALVQKLIQSGLSEEEALTQALRMAGAREEARMAGGGLAKAAGKTPKKAKKAAGGRVDAPEGAEDFIAQVKQRMAGSKDKERDMTKAEGGAVIEPPVDQMRLEMMERGYAGGSIVKRLKPGSQAAKGAGQAKQSVLPPEKPRELTGLLRPDVDPVRGQTSRELTRAQNKALTDQQKEMLEGLKKKFPDFAASVKFMTPQEVGKILSNPQGVQEVNRLLELLPQAKQLSSVAKAGEAKRGWYRASTQALIDVFGNDAPRFATLLASLSPQTSVEMNLLNTLNVWKNWTAAGRPTDPARIKQIMGQSVAGTKGEQSVLDAWTNNAIRSLTVADPAKVTLSGPKVDSFFRNLADDVYRVTNDAWMASGLGVGQDLFSGAPTALQIARGDPGLTPGYIATSARMREAGQQANMLPSEAQETTWSVFMPLYEMQRSTGIPARDILQRGLLTPQQIRGTPDFSSLLQDPKYGSILQQAGYGENLAALKPYQWSDPKMDLSLADQRELEKVAERLEGLKSSRERESRAKVFSMPSGRPQSGFAYETPEYIPGRGTGHLEELIDVPLESREFFSSRAANAFKDLQGRDVLQQSLQLPTIQTRSMTGAFRPPGEIPYASGRLGGETIPGRHPVEVQPGFAMGAEVPITSNLDIPERIKRKLTAAAGVRGAMTAQLGSPWNLQIPTKRGSGLFVPLDKKVAQENMQLSGALMDPNTEALADTGRGVAMLNWGSRLSDDEARAIAQRLGANDLVRTKNVSDYVDYSPEWNQPPGSGAVTRKMLSLVDELNKADIEALSRATQEPAGKLYELYEQLKRTRGYATREDLMHLLKTLRDKGIPGVITGLAAGEAFAAPQEKKAAGGLASLQRRAAHY